MKSTILNFYKTEHFLFRQWDRDIDDNILLKSLSSLKETPKGKNLIIVGASIINEWVDDCEVDRKYKSKRTNLFIIVQDHTLITCFREKFSHYQGRKDKVNYLLIQKS